ncbi:MAG: hypothetical protein VYA54_05540 [Bdellovibrionota bacterium]|nr:hypothetical protein [Bdellovibrionota bacterium]
MLMTFTQRLVLETLQKDHMDHRELSSVLGIDLLTLRVLMEDFIVKGIVLQNEDGIYRLNKKINEETKKGLVDQKSLHLETIDFLSDCVEDRLLNSVQNSFNCKKISMSESEYKMYQALIINLKSFVEGLEKNSAKDRKHHQIIYWGERSYENATRHALNY